MSDTALTSEQIEEKRQQKLAERRYFLVSLSDKVIPDGEPFRCHKCGVIVQTVYNEPKAQIEIKVLPEDIGEGKLVGSLCRKDNILFHFI
jgi:hypothetical protein